MSELGRRVDDRQAMELGRRLGATVVVSGAYQRMGPRIRITAQVVEVSGGRSIATVKIDGSVDELFELQDRLVTELTEGLQVDVGQRDARPSSMPAPSRWTRTEAYSRGMLNLRLAGKDSIERAIALLEQAVKLDPNYVEALVALSGALELKGSFLAQHTLFDRSLALVQEAIAIRPTDGDAHIQLGDTLLSMGRADEAIAALEEGLRLQPDRAQAHSILARAYWLRQRPDRRRDQGVRAHPAVEPRRRVYASAARRLLYTLRGDLRAAEDSRAMRSACRIRPCPALPASSSSAPHARLGYVEYRQGRYDEAIREVPARAGDAVGRRITCSAIARPSSCSRSLERRIGGRATSRPPRCTRRKPQAFEARLAAGGDEPYTRYYIAALYATARRRREGAGASRAAA